MEKKNVIIFGESGSGKSSAINLLLGRQAAKISDSALGCTLNFQKHDAPDYFLYDTVGLSEGSKGTVKEAVAMKNLIRLLKSLESGVALLVFVIRKDKIKKSIEENYNLFVDAICMNKVPVVLLITSCEQMKNPETWWIKNKECFDQYGMKFNAVVCGSTGDAADPELSDESCRMIAAMRTSTLLKLRSSIQTNILQNPWKVEGGLTNWLTAILKTVWNIFIGWFGWKNPFEGWGSSLYDRILRYFLSKGYDLEASKSIASECNSA